MPSVIHVQDVPAATYVGVAPGVGVSNGVVVGDGLTAAPRALATSIRPKD